MLEPACRYQVSVQATEIQPKELGLVCKATVNHLAIESTQGHEDKHAKGWIKCEAATPYVRRRFLDTDVTSYAPTFSVAAALRLDTKVLADLIASSRLGDLAIKFTSALPTTMPSA